MSFLDCVLSLLPHSLPALALPVLSLSPLQNLFFFSIKRLIFSYSAYSSVPENPGGSLMRSDMALKSAAAEVYRLLNLIAPNSGAVTYPMNEQARRPGSISHIGIGADNLISVEKLGKTASTSTHFANRGICLAIEHTVYHPTAGFPPTGDLSGYGDLVRPGGR
jgi:hypothetical protein